LCSSSVPIVDSTGVWVVLCFRGKLWEASGIWSKRDMRQILASPFIRSVYYYYSAFWRCIFIFPFNVYIAGFLWNTLGKCNCT
jgi:hypothetical protein